MFISFQELMKKDGRRKKKEKKIVFVFHLSSSIFNRL